MACMSLCLSSQPVLSLTPSWRPSCRAEMPFLVCESRYMARKQVVRGSLAAWKRVPASSEIWRLQWLHWKVVRRVESRQKRAEPQRGQERPSGQRAWNRSCSHCGSVP